MHLESDSISGGKVNVNQQPFLYCFALGKSSGRKIYKKPRFKLLKRKNKSVLSQITFFLEDDGHTAVDFKGETINFTCQLYKIY